MTVRRDCLVAMLPLLFLAAALPGRAVTIQYAGGYGSGADNFTGVANLYGCSGALLADGLHVLTAAHCADGSTPPSALSFFTSSYPSGFTDAITGVHLNPLSTVWFPSNPDSPQTYDLAILDLATPAPADATRYTLNLSGVTVGEAVTMAGWGLGGYPGGSVDGTGGTRRAGTNTVAGFFGTATDGKTTVPLPDDPIELAWTTTGDTGTSSDTTGLSNAGDSGGPLLNSSGELIGITSFGNLPRSGDVPIGQTFEAGYVNLASPGNADWIESVLEAPEPGTWMLAVGGAFLVLLRRRALRR